MESAANYRIRAEKESQYVQTYHPFPEVMDHAAELREKGWDVRVALVGAPENCPGRWMRVEGVVS